MDWQTVTPWIYFIAGITNAAAGIIVIRASLANHHYRDSMNKMDLMLYERITALESVVSNMMDKDEAH